MGKRLEGALLRVTISPPAAKLLHHEAAEDERELRELLRASVELVERRLQIVGAPVSPKCAAVVALHGEEDAWLAKAKAVLG